MKHHSLFAITLATAMLTLGCQRNSDAKRQPGDNGHAPNSATAHAPGHEAAQEKSAFVTAMKRELAILNGELDEFAAKAEQAGASVKAEAQPQIEAMRQRAARLNQRIDEAAEVSEANWQTFRSDVATTYEASKAEVQQARQWLSDKIAP